MARFSGIVGYVSQEETAPGVWTPVNKPRKMKGNVLRQTSSNSNSGNVNDDVTLNHRVSLIGDAYAFENYFNIKWVKMDTKVWKVTNIEIERPRIIVTLGGVWNGEISTT